MARGKKTGGRKKGTLNRRTVEFRALLEERGFSCPDEWLSIYETLKNAPEALLYMDHRIDVLKQLTMYVHPKPKDMDVTGSPEQSVANAEKAHTLLKEMESQFENRTVHG